MRLSFTATDFGFESDEVALVAGVLGVDFDGSEHCLSLQRDAVESLDDLGVYLEFDEQGTGSYGSVASCCLSRDALRVELSGQLGALVGVTGFDIALHPDPDSYDSLSKGLPLIFRGQLGALSIDDSCGYSETPPN